MNKKDENIFITEISRKKFLYSAIGSVVFVSLPVNWLCKKPGSEKRKNQTIPQLKGLTKEEYININSMAEVFLKNSPIENFDAGASMDHYIYSRIEPLSIQKKLKELFAVPSSVLVALIFDFSLTPMRDLPVIQREARLQKWKTSSISLKQTVYHAFRQGTMLALTSTKSYQDYTGYTEEYFFKPFIPNKA